MLRSASLALSSLFLGALALSAAGCEGCLGLDQYQVVPTGGNAGSGGTGGTGGTGGAPGCGAPSLLFVSAAQEAADPGDGADDCALVEPVGAGIEVRAFDSESRACVARARVVAGEGATLETLPRIRSTQGDLALLAARFQGGPLAFPPLCDTGDPVAIEPPPGAADTLVVATLRLDAETFCTVWTRRAWTELPADPSPLQVRALDLDPTGRAAIAGSLGGATVFFEDEAGSQQQLTAAAFFAQYSQTGTLQELVRFEDGAPRDAILDMIPATNQWILTGTVQREQPTCQGCSGTVHVTEPAAVSCPGAGGTGGVGGTGGTGGSGGLGGTGGTGGTGGSGGMTTTGGSGGVGGTGGTGGATGVGGSGATGGTGGTGGGMPVVDNQNAFLWPHQSSSDSCQSFTTFGSDRLGDDDAQIGFGLSSVPSYEGCSLFFSGLAGRDAWRLSSSDASTALFDAGGATMDAFIARTDGSGPLCDGTAGPRWNVRLTPFGAGASAVTERVSGERCSSFATSVGTTLVRGGTSGNLSMYRCTTGEACETSATLVPLAAGADPQIVVTALRYDGTFDWSAAFGPVRAGGDAGAGTFTGRSHHDLARDGFDDIYLVLTTDGPLAMQNVSTIGACEGLVPDLAPGTYVLALRQFSGGTATCDWAYRLGL